MVYSFWQDVPRQVSLHSGIALKPELFYYTLTVIKKGSDFVASVAPITLAVFGLFVQRNALGLPLFSRLSNLFTLNCLLKSRLQYPCYLIHESTLLKTANIACADQFP